MAGKSRVTAGDQQRNALLTLAHSRDRGEADRARAILLTLSGWTSPRIAEAFSVREDTVRLWRSEFARGGVEALKATVALGPPPVKTEAALRVVAPLLEAPVADLDDPAPHGRDRGARGRQDRQVAVVQGVAKKNFRWRRPRHTLKGRQIAAEIERVGLRLQLRKAQAEAGDIILLYGDESEALTHPYLARAWALRGADLRAPAPGQAKKVAIIGSLDHVTRQLIVHTSQTKRSRDFIAHLEQLDHLFGPQPGRAIKPSYWSRTTGRSMSASSLLKPSRRANTGSPSSGCQNTHPNSTTSRLSGTISRRAIWPIRPSLMPTSSTAQSTQPWLP